MQSLALAIFLCENNGKSLRIAATFRDLASLRMSDKTASPHPLCARGISSELLILSVSIFLLINHMCSYVQATYCLRLPVRLLP